MAQVQLDLLIDKYIYCRISTEANGNMCVTPFIGVFLPHTHIVVAFKQNCPLHANTVHFVM